MSVIFLFLPVPSLFVLKVKCPVFLRRGQGGWGGGWGCRPREGRKWRGQGELGQAGLTQLRCQRQARRGQPGAGGCSPLAWPGPLPPGGCPLPPLTLSQPLFPRQPSPGPGLATRFPDFTTGAGAESCTVSPGRNSWLPGVRGAGPPPSLPSLLTG